MIRFNRGERIDSVIEPVHTRTAEWLEEFQRLIDIIPGQVPPDPPVERESEPVIVPETVPVAVEVVAERVPASDGNRAPSVATAAPARPATPLTGRVIRAGSASPVAHARALPVMRTCGAQGTPPEPKTAYIGRIRPC